MITYLWDVNLLSEKFLKSMVGPAIIMKFVWLNVMEVSHFLLTRLFMYVGEKKILFADVVSKINKRNKMQQRVLMITGKFFCVKTLFNYSAKP